MGLARRACASTWFAAVDTFTLIDMLLYHYTTQSGLVGIVQSESLWLTDVRYLNDASEYVYALHLAGLATDEALTLHDRPMWLLREAISSSLRSVADQVMVASLSEEGDLLSQWRGYCRSGTEVAIGFDRHIIQELASEIGAYLRKARYVVSQQQKLIRRQFDYASRKMKRRLIRLCQIGEERFRCESTARLLRTWLS